MMAESVPVMEDSALPTLSSKRRMLPACVLMIAATIIGDGFGSANSSGLQTRRTSTHLPSPQHGVRKTWVECNSSEATYRFFDDHQQTMLTKLTLGGS